MAGQTIKPGQGGGAITGPPPKTSGNGDILLQGYAYPGILPDLLIKKSSGLVNEISAVTRQSGVGTTEMNTRLCGGLKGEIVEEGDFMHPRVELMVAIGPPGQNLKAEIDLGRGLELKGGGHDLTDPHCLVNL
jgi:hypothetical protein